MPDLSTAPTRRYGEHGPQLVVREDHTPLSAYRQQEHLLDAMRTVAERHRRDAALLNDMARHARQQRISWRRIADALGLPFKSVYDRARAGRPVLPIPGPR